jgi:hypothetical protein
MPLRAIGLSFHVVSGKVEFDRSGGGWGPEAEHHWGKALPQIERRLQAALRNPPRYNRFVARHLPQACRTGKIRRGLTWSKGTRSVLPLSVIRLLEMVLPKAEQALPWPTMTAAGYLVTAGIAYDAVFRELRRLPPRRKYETKADGRHGGLLDLPERDADAFADWFRSRRWAGTHPWEIVFGHPQGVLLSPRVREDGKGWDFVLWVDSPGWYASSARMALALGEADVPLEFSGRKEVLDAVRGLDEVEVGPGLHMLGYEDLVQNRPDSLRFIRWDPVPQMEPIAADQAERVAKAEADG